MYKFTCISILCLGLLGCNRSGDATQQLEKARSLYEQDLFGSAKLILDDVKAHYPKDVNSQKKVLQLMREIEIKEKERDILFCDSVIRVDRVVIDSLKRQFVLEKTEYDYEGHYIPKSWNPCELASPHFIKINTNESGVIALISIYKGNAIRYDKLKASVASDEYAETQAIPFDGGANYTFQDISGITYQIVTFQKGRDNGVIMFIYNQATKNITIAYEGGKKVVTFALTNQEKQAVVQTVNLATVLSDFEKARAEKEKAQKRLEYLQSTKWIN